MDDTDGMSGPPGADAAAAQPLPPMMPPKHAGFTGAMKAHGVAKGANKRHPATGHYNMGPRGNRFGKK